MCQGRNACQQGWAKNLDAGCPPQDVEAPADEVLYRNAKTAPPTEADYLSTRELSPARAVPRGYTECHMRAVSLWTTALKCEMLRKHKMFRDTVVVSVTLTPTSGAVQRRADGHVSWWACGAFDALGASAPVGGP